MNSMNSIDSAAGYSYDYLDVCDAFYTNATVLLLSFFSFLSVVNVIFFSAASPRPIEPNPYYVVKFQFLHPHRSFPFACKSIQKLFSNRIRFMSVSYIFSAYTFTYTQGGADGVQTFFDSIYIHWHWLKERSTPKTMNDAVNSVNVNVNVLRVRHHNS